MRTGRPPGSFGVRDDARFFRLWMDPAVRITAIVAELDVCEATVYATAERLGLPMRSTIRADLNLSSHGPLSPRTVRDSRALIQDRVRQTNRLWAARNEAHSLARVERWLAAERAAEVRPRYMRCEDCQGARDVTDTTTHTQCRRSA